MNDTELKRISVILPEGLKKSATVLAKQDGRSLNAWINRLVLKAVQEKIPPKPTFFFDPENHQG